MRTKRPVSAEERARIIALAKDSTPQKEIARLVDRPMGTVSRVVSDAILTGELQHSRSWETPRTLRSYDY